MLLSTKEDNMKRCFVYLLGSALVVTFAMSCNDETEPMEQQPVITDEAQENINQAAQDIQQDYRMSDSPFRIPERQSRRNWQRSVLNFRRKWLNCSRNFRSYVLMSVRKWQTPVRK
jgi:hypothetical protein